MKKINCIRGSLAASAFRAFAAIALISRGGRLETAAARRLNRNSSHFYAFGEIRPPLRGSDIRIARDRKRSVQIARVNISRERIIFVETRDWIKAFVLRIHNFFLFLAGGEGGKSDGRAVTAELFTPRALSASCTFQLII